MSEESEVDTYVPVLTFLPSEVRVYVLGRSPNLEVLAIIRIATESLHCRERPVAVEVLVTGHTVVTTDLEFVDPSDILHEVFVRDTPSGRNCREVTPLVVCTET